MIRKKILSVSILIFSVFITGIAQSGQVAPKLIPNSPEAASLGKYAEIPVSYYTGIPQINIPIYDVKAGNLQVNVGLSYHSGGIRLEEMASWVGSGWTLNAGGIITRSVRGKPDDSETFGGFLEFSKNRTLQSIYSLPEEQRLTTYDAIGQGCYDAEPDIFFLNVNGITAKFCFKWNDEGLSVSSDRKLKIICIKGIESGSSWPKILGWDITDEDGTLYKFRDKEKTFTYSPGAIACQAPESFNSSWYLSEIVDVNNENKILFSYDSYTLDFGFKSTQTRKFFLGLLGPPAGCLPPAATNGSLEESTDRTQIFGLRIKEITTENGNTLVSFFSGNERTDIGSLSLPPAGTTQNYKNLEKIVVKNQLNNEVQSYKFNYGYSTGRLTLNSILPTNNMLEKSPPYQFDYINGLPAITSYNFSQDHWGFYNDATNTTLVPDYWHTTTAGEIYVAGANRQTNPNVITKGMISKISYPTGGKIEFDFECNEYGFSQNQPVLYYGKSTQNFNASVNGSNITVATTNTTNFTVNANPLDNSEKIPVNFSYTAHTQAVTAGLKPWVKLSDANGNEIFFQRFNFDPDSPDPGTTTGTFLKRLSPGTYSLQAYCVALNGENASIDADFNDYDLNAPKYKKYCGGVRIKQIREFASENDVNFTTKSFVYNYENSNAKSSGVIYQEPLYEYPFIYYCYGVIEGVTFPVLSSGQYLVQLASNKLVLGETQGSHIGYREIKVLYGKDGKMNGSKVFKFSSPFEFGDDVYFNLPYRPSASQNYKTGLLTQQWDYKRENAASTETAVKSSENQYVYSENMTAGLRVIKTLTTNSTSVRPEFFLIGDYPNILGFSQVSMNNTKTYSQSNSQQFVMTTTQNEFDTELKKIKRQTSTKSDGTKSITDFYYPHDYTMPSVTINKMKELNVVGNPIETITKIGDGTSEYVLSGLFQQFEYSNLKLRQNSNLSFKATQPIPANNFSYSINNTGAVFDSKYLTEITYNLYDSKSNVLQYTTRDGIPVAFVWGYKQSLPIAKIIGATYAQILTALGQTDQNLTYLQSLDGTPLITELNKIRTYLAVNKPKAQVATYTYMPLVGMLTQTDPNGRIMTYEYDNFQRLKFVKDQDGNIVKKFCYNYAGQQIDCFGNSTAPQWQTIAGTSSCQPCAINNNFNTGYLRHQEKDNNTYSGTYNQTRWVTDGLSATCPLEVWENTATAIRCRKDALNANTGEQEQEQKDMNPCSPTYNLLRWIVIGTNTTACPSPAPCGGACNVQGRKCINNSCERGIKVYTSSNYNATLGQYVCVYHYEFSDGSWSTDYTEYSNTGCAIQ